MLVDQLIGASEKGDLKAAAEKERAEAFTLLKNGSRAKAARHLVRAYEILYY